MEYTQHRRLEKDLLFITLIIFLILQCFVILTSNINWDEYHFLSHVYAFRFGWSHEVIQRFHAPLLVWLTLVPLNEADQIVSGRALMLICQIFSLFFVFHIARQFTSTENALVGVLAWSAAGFTLMHGASFRFDPLAGSFMMASIAIVFCSAMSLRSSLLAGVLGAVGILVTIKSTLYLPAFVGAIFWQSRQRGEIEPRAVRQIVISGATILGTIATLSLAHTWLLSLVAERGVRSQIGSSERYAQIIDKVFLSQSLFPRMFEIVQWSLLSIPFLALVILGLWHAWRYRGDVAGRLPAAIGLAAPLLVLVVYRNAFPYFFPFITLPVAVVAGLGAASIRSGAVRYAVIAALAILIGFRFVAALETDQSAQRETASVVHQMFVEPVPYIDRNGMIPSFPKSGIFMSGWGMDNYRAGLTPSLEQTIAEDSPPLLIANSPWLERALVPEQQHLPNRLLERDAQLLRDNYIHHWGAIWIAGKELDADTQAFDIVIPGHYLLRCEGERVIKRRTIRCGETVHLARGTFTYGGGPAEMRWGGELPKPSREPSDKPIFYSF